MPKRPIRAEDLLRMVFVGDPQISPDGSRILFTRKHIGEKNKVVTNLCTVDADGVVTQWTQGQDGAGNGRWCPDGSAIAFVSGREDKVSQIFVIPTTGGEARRLSKLPQGSIGSFKWAPNGKLIAFTFRHEMPRFTKEAEKEREESGASRPPIEIDDILYRLDGDGYFAGQRYALYLLDVSSGEHRELYGADPHGDYAFDWSPNSDELAVIHNATANPFVDPPNKQIWRVDLEGQAWKLEGLPKGEKCSPRWSPDGAWIAYAGNVDEEDPWGTRNDRAWIVPAGGGEPRCLTEASDYDLGVATLSDTGEASDELVLHWAPDGRGLYAQVGWHGGQQLALVSIDGGIELLTEGHHRIEVGNVSRDGRRIAASLATATRLAEVAALETELVTGRWTAKVRTSLNQAFHDEVRLSEPEPFSIESTPNKDGTPSTLHGWVLKPIDYLEPRRYPAVLEIHGGPHTQYGWSFFHEFQLLAAQGYVVVYTNPRGSKGYGEGYCAEIKGDWGHKDWEDIETISRWMQHQPYIHPGQMAVMGGSYGGYMTNWVIGHSDAFRCAITDRCVSNMVSMSGNSDFPVNKDQYFKGFAWGSLEDIAELWRQSPISYFKDVKTPTLIIHSEGDLRCNVEQAEQVFTALQMQGVESRFVRYPLNTSHGMSRGGPPDLRLHRLNEIVTWLGKHLR